MRNVVRLGVLMMAATGLTAAPAYAGSGQAHGTFSYYQASPKTVAQGAITNPLTGKCYAIPEGAALLIFNDTDSDGEAFGSADCTGTSQPLPANGGGLGSYASVRFTDAA